MSIDTGSSDFDFDGILPGEVVRPEALFPVLRHVERPNADSEVRCHFCGELAIHVVVNSPSAMRFVQRSEVESFGMSAPECMERSFANLLRLVGQDGYMLDIGDSGVGRLLIEDEELSSGLLCLDPLMSQVIQTFEGRIFASVPRRHVVLIARQDDSAVSILKQLTETAFHDKDGEGRPISSQIFTLDENCEQWQLVEFS